MDALKLRLRAKDQLHPILQELVTGYARFKGSKDWEGRSKMVGWYVIIMSPCVNRQDHEIAWSRLITLNGMKASEEITEEQSRQVSRADTINIPRIWKIWTLEQLLFDVDHAYAEFFRSLSGKDES